MGRSLKKGPYIDLKLAKKIGKQKETGARDPVKTWARAATVIPDFVGHTFNGFAFLVSWDGLFDSSLIIQCL